MSSRIQRTVSKLYDIGSSIDRRRKLNHAFRSKFPVISVGNLSVGGTGKTPVLLWLINRLQVHQPLIVLSRGYGRRTNGDVIWRSGNQVPDHRSVGDEPVLIAGILRNGILGVSRNRSKLLKIIENEFDRALVLLDDGFQHHRLVRDLDIVIIDDATVERAGADSGWRLREKPQALRRAGIILATSGKAERFSRTYIDASTPVFRLNYPVPFLVNCDGHPVKLSSDRSLLLVTGIANPERVRDSLGRLPNPIVGHLRYGDHHDYRPKDCRGILAGKQSSGADYVVTTTKDAVKLANFAKLSECLLVINQPVEIEHGEEFLNLTNKCALEFQNAVVPRNT